MKQQNNNIENLFREKLQNLEANPGANAWANVQTGIASNTATATTSAGSSWASSVIVGLTITAIAVGGYFFFNEEGEKKKVKAETKVESQVSQEASVTENDITNPNEEESNSTIKTTINVETSAEEQKQSKNNTIVTIDKSDNVTTNKVGNETTENTDNGWVTEKTIDEIIAEHQQFIDEQEIPTSDNNQSDPQIVASQSEKTIPSSSVQSTSVPNDVMNDSESIAEMKLKQRRIAGQVVFPNIFSPGLDGHNDIFKITLEQSIEFENVVVNILNLNGKVIKTWSEARGSWDGNYPDGSSAPAGTYRYQAVIIKDGESIPKQGSFKLIR